MSVTELSLVSRVTQGDSLAHQEPVSLIYKMRIMSLPPGVGMQFPQKVYECLLVRRQLEDVGGEVGRGICVPSPRRPRRGGFCNFCRRIRLGSECCWGDEPPNQGTLCQACHVRIVKGLKAMSGMEIFRMLDGAVSGEGTVGLGGLLWGEGREEYGVSFMMIA